MRTPSIVATLAASIALGALFAPGAPALADMDEAMSAYERQDYGAAVEEFRRLAEQGEADARYMLGRMYATGQGVVQDYVRAHKWLNLAASQGQSQARQARSELEQRMTSAQIAQAQVLAREFQPQAAEPEFGAPAEEPLFEESELASQDLSSQSVVRAIQEALNARGYDAGPEDGVLGPKTRDAIRAYQADAGLQVSGEPSAQLVERLAIEVPGTAGAAQEEPLFGAAEPEQPSAASPRGRLIVRDAFQDGNYTEDPSWAVASGRFFVGSGNNLRSVVEQAQTAQEQDADLGEVAGAVLGAVLQETLGGGLGQGMSGTPPQNVAEIYLPQPISDAFAIEFDLRALEDTGAVALGPYRGADRTGGYRLAYVGQDQDRLELHEMTAEGSRVLATHDAPALADGGVHTLVWTRDPQGEMAVQLDGTEIMRANQSPSGEGFGGFKMRNFGGDYALHRIAIYGS